MNKYLKLSIIIISIISLIIIGYFVFSKYYKNNQNTISDKDFVHIKMVKPYWPGYIISALAYEMGYFKDEGIIIDYTDVPDDVDLLEELDAGRIDVQGTLSTQFLSHVRNTGVAKGKIVLITDYSNGGDAIIARKDAPDIKSNSKKKLSGLEDYEFFLPYTLDLMDISTTTFEFIKITSDDERVDALLNGKIDFAVTYEPYLSKAVSAGAKVVYSSADNLGVITDVLVFNNKLLESNPKIAVKFAKAYFKAYDYWHSNPKEAREATKKFYRTLPEEFDKQMQGVKLLSLDDNIRAMSVNAGFNSLYGNLQNEQLFINKLKGEKIIPINSLIYPNVLRELSR